MNSKSIVFNLKKHDVKQIAKLSCQEQNQMITSRFHAYFLKKRFHMTYPNRSFVFLKDKNQFFSTSPTKNMQQKIAQIDRKKRVLFLITKSTNARRRV